MRRLDDRSGPIATLDALRALRALAPHHEDRVRLAITLLGTICLAQRISCQRVAAELKNVMTELPAEAVAELVEAA